MTSINGISRSKIDRPIRDPSVKSDPPQRHFSVKKYPYFWYHFLKTGSIKFPETFAWGIVQAQAHTSPLGRKYNGTHVEKKMYGNNVFSVCVPLYFMPRGEVSPQAWAIHHAKVSGNLTGPVSRKKCMGMGFLGLCTIIFYAQGGGEPSGLGNTPRKGFRKFNRASFEQ